MLKVFSLFKRCITLLVHAVHGRLRVNNRFAASAVTCTISQLRTPSERKLSFLATKPPFTALVNLALLLCLPFVELALPIVFSSFIRLMRYARASQLACLRLPRPNHNRDSSEKVRRCSTKEPITTNTSIAEDSCASYGHATLNCAILSKHELSRPSAHRQIETGLYFPFKLLSISL